MTNEEPFVQHELVRRRRIENGEPGDGRRAPARRLKPKYYMPTTTQIHEALSQSSHPSAQRLQTALTRCGHDWFGSFACNRPACETCRNRYIGRQRRAATERFSALGNESLGLVSLVVAATTDLEAVPAIWATLRKDLRNLVDSMRRRDGLWALTEFALWLEMDALAPEDFQHLPPEKRVQLGKLAPAILFEGQPVWIVTCHGIVAHPMQTSEQICARLAQRWSAPGQVHVRPFYQLDFAKNVAGVVNYSLKHQSVTSLESKDEDHFTPIKSDWPLSWVAEYHAFLNGWSRGFQSMRITIGRKNAKPSRCGKPSNNRNHEVYRQQHSDNETDTALSPLPLTEGGRPSAVSILTALPTALALRERYAWPPASSIPIPMSPDDPDRPERIAEMHAYNAHNARGRWRMEAPKRGNEVIAHFEDDFDAVMFRLRFG